MKFVQVEIKDEKKFKETLADMPKAFDKAMENTRKDFYSRAPGWISSEVIQTYNIKKSEVKPAKRGTSGESISIMYSGRLLTPTHFSMTPKEPKPAYTLKATIYKGQRKTLGKVKKLTKKQRANVAKNLTHQGTRSSTQSPIMLMRIKTKAAEEKYIPFQRMSEKRNDLKAIKTLSIPQMITNDQVAERIQGKINEELSKRIEHHLNRILPK